MSPRRSSRARTTQPSNPQLPTSAAASSQSSSRDVTRLNSHQESNRGSASEGHSTEDEAGGRDKSEANARQTRQRKNEHSHEPPNVAAADPTAIGEDEDDELEEEVTRCVCFKDEYPGKPVPLSESGRTRFENAALVRNLSNGVSDVGAEGDLFIQCDTCKVWQHGGCVGIMEESQCPDNYYCEQCRPELHRLMTGARAQRYSRYLPVVEPNTKPVRRPSSSKRESEAQPPPETGTKTASIKPAPSSRSQRGTVNSRAAWEEEQMLMRAIEASKEYGASASGGEKRRRDSDITLESDGGWPKRKRVHSPSGYVESSPPAEGLSADAKSDDESRSRGGNGHGKKARGVAAQAQREKEQKEREKERERERAEAAGRRKGRAERRHADESEPPEDEKGTPSTSKGTNKAKSAPPPKAAQSTPTPTAPPVKKSSRPQRKGRVGRNQYTREREMEGEKASPPGSRDSEDAGHSGDGQAALLANGSKPSRPRHLNPNRTSMNELRKRAAGILEFITRTQVELAGEKTPPDPSTAVLGEAARKMGQSKLKQEIDSSEVPATTSADEGHEGSEAGEKIKVDERAFASLPPRDMMDVLTRELLVWQHQHGKYALR